MAFLLRSSPHVHVKGGRIGAAISVNRDTFSSVLQCKNFQVLLAMGSRKIFTGPNGKSNRNSLLRDDPEAGCIGRWSMNCFVMTYS